MQSASSPRVSRCLNPYEKAGLRRDDGCSRSAKRWNTSSPTPPRPASCTTPRASQFDDCPPDFLSRKADTACLHAPLARAGRPGRGDALLRADRQQRQGAAEVRATNTSKQWELEEGFHRLGEQGLHLLLHAGGPHRTRAAFATPTRAGCAWRRTTATRTSCIDVGEVFGVWDHRGPRVAGGQAAVQEGRRLNCPGGARCDALQEAQGPHPERRAHRLCAGRVSGRL